MNRTRIAAAAMAAALSGGGLVATAPSAGAAPTSVTGVQFRWGINNESNNRGAAPGTFNLFAAGKLGNPGTGGQLLNNADSGATWSNGAAAGWQPSAGNARVEKLRADGSYAAATWAGTKTDKDGTSLGSYSTNTTFSDHQVVIAAGTGTVDAAADDADLSWDGDFTVVYYSGYTFFYVSDPHLHVDGGSGTVTATVSGYQSDMNDQSQWNALPPTTVTLATLTGVDVTANGLVTTPAYRGVTYDAPADGTPQVRSGADWGSFPSDFADFQQLTGQGAYWYSSGGSIDKNKVPLPLTVSLSPAPPVVVVPKAKPSVGVVSAVSYYGRAATVTVTVAAPAGRTVSGTITLTGGGNAQKKTLAGNRAAFALSKALAPRSYGLVATYSGNAQLVAAAGKRVHTVTKAPTSRPTLKIKKKPGPKRTGRVVVSVRSAISGVVPTGTATFSLSKGSVRKKVTALLRGGVAAATLPKLKKGKWRIVVTYGGSSVSASSVSAKYSVVSK